MNGKISLLGPENGASVSFLTEEQRNFFTDPHRFEPHKPDPEPRKKDGTIPQPAVFLWKNVTGASELELSENPDFRIFRCYPGKAEGQSSRAEVFNLLTGRKYYWRVRAGKKLSEIRSFTTASEVPRWIHLPDVTNVRDLGGWKTADGKKVRQGMVYRGGQFEAWTKQPTCSAMSEAGKKVFLEELKIRTELDLRSNGTRILDGIPRYEKIPVQAYASWNELGVFSEEQQQNVKKIFELLADPASYPLYFHCQGGGDRTGTIAFLLEAMLGLDEESLFTEYELSNLSVSGERIRYSDVWTGFMKKLETFAPGGSRRDQVSAYLRQAGITDEIQNRIRSLLLE